MLKRRGYLLGSALLSLAAIAGCMAAGPGKKARDTTVCELYDQLSSPPPGRVHVKAVVFRAPRHGTVLTDPQCPGKTIGLRLPDSAAPGTSVARFDAALTGDVMDLSLRVFDVEVAGTLEAAGPSRPEALLVVDEVYRFHARGAESRVP